ncbi:MAG: ABC transporter ATP-binding protein [Burkholderiaceae bacterium]
MNPQSPLLSVRDLHAHYGKSHILRGVSLQVMPGEIVSLLGRNGSGRSTTLKTIMGIVRATSGSVSFDRRDISAQRPYRICRAGIGYVPEEREVFANLTVDENLRMGEQPARPGHVAWSTQQLLDYFPVLRERRNTRAGNLSGGEQQMLTLCRSLLGNPRLLLVDEPTEGLAPRMVAVMAEAIRDIHRRGVAIILVEQRLAIALQVSDRLCVMGHGTIVFTGNRDELLTDPAILRDWLAV